ncbi:MAG: amidohydrolase family protein [Planctomycetota bacterium]
MKAPTHFDARIMLGPGDWTGPDQPVTPEAVISAMDHFGIHEALVIEARAEGGDMEWSNRDLVERTKEYPRLHPVWSVLPPQTGEQPEPGEMIAQMREHGVAAAWLSYGAFGIPLEEWCLGPLLRPMEEARVPLFLCPTDPRDGAQPDATDWSGVVRLCRSFPDLPVIVTEDRIYKSQRALCAALDACPNLHIDISAVWLHRFIEFLCARFGAERMVRGSQLPYRTPGATLMQLNYSEISDEEKALIAGGNIRRLISWNENVRSVADEAVLPAPMDSYHRTAREAADLSGLGVYDCHGHIGGRNQRHIVRDSADELIHEMDRLGLQVCCLFTWILQGDIVAANDRAYEAAERYPDRFVAFTALNPNHGEAEARSELERGLRRGARGVKLVNTIHRYPSDGPIVHLACRFAHEHRLFILNHAWGPADLMRRLCETYPNACFIAGHSDGGYGEVVKTVGNLYICSCPFLRWGQTEEYVRRYGADRILYGSDLLDLPITWGYGPIFYAKISEADKKKILTDNIRSLLEKYGIH